MPTNRFKLELIRIQSRFNKTIGINCLINPKIRISVVYSIIRLGLLEHKISDNFDAKDIREFTKIANILEKIFVKVDSLNNGKTRI